MFALCAAGGRNRIQVNTMTEQRPVYHADLAALATERRRAMTYAALNDAGAAEAALYAVRRQLGDLRQCAEALGVNLP